MDDLTGDGDEVAAFAATWANVSTSLQGSADELRRVLGDVDACEGVTMDAYRRFQQDAADHIAAAGDWASAMSTGMQVASVIVQVVHDLVRDAIAQVVGSVISYAATLALTAGVATPYVAAQATARVASLSARVVTTLTRLVRSVSRLSGIIEALTTLFRHLDDLVAPLLRAARSIELPTFTRHTDTPTVRGPDTPDTPGPPRTGDDPPDPDPSPPEPDPTGPDVPPAPDPLRHKLPGLTDEEYLDLLQQSVKNPDADRYMLGKWAKDDTSYIARAGDDHVYFDLGEKWDKLIHDLGVDKDDLFKAFNLPFLEEAVASRKPIDFSHDPSNEGATALGDEYRFLLNPPNNYRLKPNGDVWTMVPPGPLHS